MTKLLILLLLTLPLGSAYGQKPLMPRGMFWDKPAYVSARIGFLKPGVVKLDGHDEETQTGFTFGVGADFRVAKNWFIGTSVDIHRFHLADSGQYFIDVTGNIKRMFFHERNRFGFRPGLAIGFGVMDYFAPLNHEKVERTSYMTWKTTFEAIFFGRGRLAPYVEGGLMGVAFGGNEKHNINFGPSPYFRAGVMF
jgi:hypothetical protein